MIGNLRRMETLGLLEDVLRIDPSSPATGGLREEAMTIS